MRKKIVIIGAGGFGREVFNLINKDLFEIIGFIDNVTNVDSNLPLPIIGDDNLILKLKEKGIADHACVTIGNLQKRKAIFETAFISELFLPQIIHSSSTILTSISLGFGVVIYPNVVVMNDCNIGRGVLLNAGVTLGHDVIVGDFSSINPGAHIAGKVRIGQEVLIGIGASIRENVIIGNRVIIGAGSVVINDIPDNSIAYGIPAKVMQSNI